MAYLVKIALALDVDTDAEAADAVNEILREQQRSFAPDSCLLDYAIEGEEEFEADVADYAEGDFLGWKSDTEKQAEHLAAYLEEYQRQDDNADVQCYLDDLVMDTFEAEASDVNNKGFAGQLCLLLEKGHTPDGILKVVGCSPSLQQTNGLTKTNN